MKTIWAHTEKICKKHRWNAVHVFFLWNVSASVVGSVIPGILLALLLSYLKGVSVIVTLVTFAGYCGVFVGFFGGALYLMQKEPSQLDV